MATVRDIQEIIFKYYPQGHDLKRTWDCAREIAGIFMVQRWIERYNNRSRYPCKHKGCLYKLRNGRCGRAMWRQECDKNDRPTGRCLDYSPRTASPDGKTNNLHETDTVSSPHDDIIEDGFGGMWSAYCPECGKKTMVVVRPGKAQCMECG